MNTTNVRTITVRMSHFPHYDSEVKYNIEYPNSSVGKPWFEEITLTKPTKRSPMGIPVKYYDFEYYWVKTYLLKEMGLWIPYPELFNLLCNLTNDQKVNITKLLDYGYIPFFQLRETNRSQQRVYGETIGPKFNKMIYDYLKSGIPMNPTKYGLTPLKP